MNAQTTCQHAYDQIAEEGRITYTDWLAARKIDTADFRFISCELLKRPEVWDEERMDIYMLGVRVGWELRAARAAE